MPRELNASPRPHNRRREERFREGHGAKRGGAFAEDVRGAGEEASLFVNHLALLIAYRVCERLRDNGRLREYAAVKMLDNYLRDVRVSNVSDGRQLKPIPKAARKAIEALGLTPPTSLPDAQPMA